MVFKSYVRHLGFALGLAVAGLGASMQNAQAVPVDLDTWYEFLFSGPGTPLIGCAAESCSVAFNPPDGDPVVLVGDAPWTITTTETTELLVLDLFDSTDQFQISDNMVVLGVTSVPIPGGSCDGDITCALGDLRYSRAEFTLAPGTHSLTGIQLLGNPGAAVFHMTAARVPEPATLALLGLALAGLGFSRRRRIAT